MLKPIEDFKVFLDDNCYKYKNVIDVIVLHCAGTSLFKGIFIQRMSFVTRSGQILLRFYKTIYGSEFGESPRT